MLKKVAIVICAILLLGVSMYVENEYRASRKQAVESTDHMHGSETHEEFVRRMQLEHGDEPVVQYFNDKGELVVYTWYSPEIVNCERFEGMS